MKNRILGVACALALTLSLFSGNCVNAKTINENVSLEAAKLSSSSIGGFKEVGETTTSASASGSAASVTPATTTASPASVSTAPSIDAKATFVSARNKMREAKVYGMVIHGENLFSSTSSFSKLTSFTIEIDRNTGIIYYGYTGMANAWVDTNKNILYMGTTYGSGYYYEPYKSVSINDAVSETDDMLNIEEKANATFLCNEYKEVTIKNVKHNCYVITTNEIDSTETSSSLQSSYSTSGTKTSYTFYVGVDDNVIYGAVATSKTSSYFSSSSKATENTISIDFYYPDSVVIPTRVKSSATIAPRYSVTKRGVTYTSAYLNSKRPYFYVSKTKKKATIKIMGNVKVLGKKYKVYTIVQSAFKSNNKVRKIIIPPTVKNINNNSFSKCKKLKRIKVNVKKLNRRSRRYIMKLKKKKHIKISR